MSEQKRTDEKELVEFVVTARKYKTTLSDKYLNRKKWEKPIQGEVKSFLPGTVIRLYVKEGQQIKEGELLLEHEAMKMLNKIISPVSGVVSRINVEEGQKVPKNFLMVEVTPQ